jgi:hypothetical protein
LFFIPYELLLRVPKGVRKLLKMVEVPLPLYPYHSLSMKVIWAAKTIGC